MSIQAAEQYERNEQFEQAYEEYKKELAARPSDLGVLQHLGSIAMMLGKKNEAAEYYIKILEKDVTNVLCYEQLMDIFVDTDKYKYYVYRGNLHSVEQKYEHAINDYKKALPHATNEQEAVIARFTIANLYAQTGDANRAIDEYLKTLEYEEAGEPVYLKLAELYMQEDMLPSAIDTLERARKKFDTQITNEALANLYLRNNEPEKAMELTKDELFRVKCMLGANKLDEANEILDQNAGKYSNDAQFYALKAQYHYSKGEYEKALEYVEKYNKFNPNSPLVYQMRALIYENTKDEYREHLNWGKYNLVRGNKDIAVNEFLSAFQLNEGDVDLMNTLAMLLEETGDNNHAIEFWERISKAEPTNKKALEKLADFRENIGDYRTEVDYLEKWYELDKRNAIVVKRLAKLYEKLKNKPSAIEFYTKYTQIASNAEDIDIMRAKLQKLEHTEMQEDEGLIDKIMKLFNK